MAGETSGYGTLCSMLPGADPMSYATASRGQADKAWPEEVRDADHGVLDKLPYGVSSERDEEGSPNSAFFDSLLVCGLVYTGRPKDTSGVDSTHG